MIISEIIFNLHMNFKVVHSIPGRLRIHVPVAKKLKSEWHVEDNYFEVLKKIKGIKKVSFNYITCNALIEYDPAFTNEKSIILNLKEIAAIANKHKKVLMKYNHDEKEAAMNYFIKVLEEEFSNIEMR